MNLLARRPFNRRCCADKTGGHWSLKLTFVRLSSSRVLARLWAKNIPPAAEYNIIFLTEGTAYLTAVSDRSSTAKTPVRAGCEHERARAREREVEGEKEQQHGEEYTGYQHENTLPGTSQPILCG